MPLAFDTAVLALTTARTQSLVRSGRAGTIVTTLLRDGVMYYSCVASPRNTPPRNMEWFHGHFF